MKNWNSECDVLVSKLIARSWADRDFLSRFVTDPKTVLKEAGIVLDETIRIVFKSSGLSPENIERERILYISLHFRPETLLDENIDDWMVGAEYQVISCFCCRFCS